MTAEMFVIVLFEHGQKNSDKVVTNVGFGLLLEYNLSLLAIDCLLLAQCRVR